MLNSNFFYAVLAAIIVSLISLCGILFFGIFKKNRDKVLFWMVSFSAGTLMGGAFFHLIPESLEKFTDSIDVFKNVIFGFVGFFILERFLLWHHCHEEHCETHKVLGWQNLIGDGAHNFLDGLLLASAFLIDTKLGIATTLSVILHEIPQEIGDFGVLLYSGFSKMRALVLNLASALLAVLGVVAGFVLGSEIEGLANFLVSIAAGGFIYISASDLIPELHKERDLKKSIIAFIFFIGGIALMLFVRD